jgi:hypothetical protein
MLAWLTRDAPPALDVAHLEHLSGQNDLLAHVTRILPSALLDTTSVALSVVASFSRTFSSGFSFSTPGDLHFSN